jgi:hypothetical protein
VTGVKNNERFARAGKANVNENGLIATQKVILKVEITANIASL